jgi:hypothetical protein
MRLLLQDELAALEHDEQLYNFEPPDVDKSARQSVALCAKVCNVQSHLRLCFLARLLRLYHGKLVVVVYRVGSVCVEELLGCCIRGDGLFV